MLLSDMSDRPGHPQVLMSDEVARFSEPTAPLGEVSLSMLMLAFTSALRPVMKSEV